MTNGPLKNGVPTGRSGRRRGDPLPTPVRISSAIIAQRAYALFLERGGDHGRDLEDWLHAERELSAATEHESNEAAVSHNPDSTAKPATEGSPRFRGCGSALLET
jgi:Protein of unknown function (DUF2934)